MPLRGQRARITTPTEDRQDEVIHQEEIRIKEINPQEVEHVTHTVTHKTLSMFGTFILHAL
jgi:hypothetical protein